MFWNRDSYASTVLDNVKVTMSIGILEAEKKPENTQTVLASAKLFYKTAELIPLSIEDCVDYARIHDYIMTWETAGHTDLVETLAEGLIQTCLQDQKVDAVWVSVKKTDIFENATSVGVEVYRRR